jgi:hypothetical protein
LNLKRQYNGSEQWRAQCDETVEFESCPCVIWSSIQPIRLFGQDGVDSGDRLDISDSRWWLEERLAHHTALPLQPSGERKILKFRYKPINQIRTEFVMKALPSKLRGVVGVELICAASLVVPSPPLFPAAGECTYPHHLPVRGLLRICTLLHLSVQLFQS